MIDELFAGQLFHGGLQVGVHLGDFLLQPGALGVHIDQPASGMNRSPNGVRADGVPRGAS